MGNLLAHYFLSLSLCIIPTQCAALANLDVGGDLEPDPGSDYQEAVGKLQGSSFHG